MKILFFKSYVHAHTATLADGRVIQVAGYQDRRTRHAPQPASPDLFAPQESMPAPISASVSPPAAPAPAPTFISSLPALPGVAGNGPHALRAQNQVRRLFQAATLGDDPLAAVQAISTSRSTTFAARVDDYRQALIRHFQTAASTPAPETITVATRVPTLPPPAPVTPALPTATPLPGNLPPLPNVAGHGVHAVRAQNQVAAIQRALASDNPLNAVQAIRTTQSTGFAARVDHYRTTVLAALVLQASQQAGGEAAPTPTPPQPTPTPAPVVTPAPQPEPMPDPDQLPAPPNIVAIPNASPAQRRRAQLRVETLTAVMNARRPLLAIAAIDTLGASDPYAAQVNGYRSALHAYYTRQAAAATPTPTPDPTPAPAPAPTPAPAADNLLANPMNMSEADLGFICRPNVPLSVIVRANGIDRNGVIAPWLTAEQRQAATRYLGQPTSQQSRAREYQAGTWRPETPELRAQRQAAEAEQLRIEAENLRAAAAARAARAGAIPDIFKPRNPVGANITEIRATEAVFNAAGRFFGQPPEEVKKLMQTLVADYNSRFSMRMTADRDGVVVSFSGEHSEAITRKFTKNANGDFSVYHAYFDAGRQTGDGNGKQLFRTSLGVYEALGVSEIKVSANIDVGGYCWARFAYIPSSAAAWDNARQAFKERLNRIQQGNYQVITNAYTSNTAPAGQPSNHKGINYVAAPYPPNVLAEINAILDDPDPYALWRLADMKHNGRSVGKELMIHQSWSGKIDLNNPRQMHRLVQYIAGDTGLQSYQRQQAATPAATPPARRRRRNVQTQAA